MNKEPPSTQVKKVGEGYKSRAQSSADTAAELLANIRSTKTTAESDSAAIESAKKISADSTVKTKALAEKAVTVEERIETYEKKLAELEAACSARLKEIEGLLPGATSTGLARAFDERRKTFLAPHNRWQWIFVGSVLLIVGLTLYGLIEIYLSGSTPTYDELVRIWLSRLPVAAALVWLALHASREAALAKRLEEDYGYKSAIASSFQGFHRQMTEVGVAADSNKPLGKLCLDTLTTIASPPGRIYAQHKLVVSPTEEFTQFADAAVNTANSVNPGAQVKR